MAQMVYKGVVYNTPDTPVPAPKFQSNLGASLGLAGAIPAPPSSPTSTAPSTGSVPTSNVPAPKYNVNDPTFQNMAAPDRLKAFGADPNLAQQEIMRDKSVYGDKFNAGDMAGATAAHNWADQVRGVAGIPNTDPTYGNVPTPPQTSNQGSFVQPQKAGGPVSAQSAPTAAPSMPPPSSVPTPPANNIYTPMTQEQLKADAQARVDKQLAGLRQAVDYAKTGLKSNFDYTNQITNDRRVLENNAFGRQNNPFNGRTGYLAENMLRDRGIQDKAANDAYNNAVAAQDQKVSDFQAMAPEQQQALYDQLLSAERNFGLQEGTLTGYLNGQRTLPGQTADRNYDLGLSGLSGQLPASAGGGQTQQAQGQAFNQNLQTKQFDRDVQQDHINLANKLTEQFGVQVNPTSDPMQAYAQVAGLSTTAAQKIAQDAKQTTFDNAIKLALANNTITQTQASVLNQARQTDISQQNADTSAANSTANINNLTADNKRQQAEFDQKQGDTTYQKYFDNLKSLYTAKDPYSGAISVTNPQQLRAAILAKKLSDDDTIKMLSDFGLPIHP